MEQYFQNIQIIAVANIVVLIVQPTVKIQAEHTYNIKQFISNLPALQNLKYHHLIVVDAKQNFTQYIKKNLITRVNLNPLFKD